MRLTCQGSGQGRLWWGFLTDSMRLRLAELRPWHAILCLKIPPFNHLVTGVQNAPPPPSFFFTITQNPCYITGAASRWCIIFKLHFSDFVTFVILYNKGGVLPPRCQIFTGILAPKNLDPCPKRLRDLQFLLTCLLWWCLLPHVFSCSTWNFG